MNWLTQALWRFRNNPYVATLATSGLLGLASLGLIACTVMLLLGKWVVDARSVSLQQTVHALEAKLSVVRTAPDIQSLPARDLAPKAQYLHDVEVLQKTVRDSGLSVLGIEYKTEAQTKLPMQLRLITLRSSDNYPRIKRFLSTLLDRLPNASLRDIRLERSDGTNSLCNATLQLMFMYRQGSAPIPMSTVTTGLPDQAGHASPTPVGSKP